MAYPLHPKNTTLDPKHPRAWGQCDYSGFIGDHKDLIDQKEYSGRGLRPTGYRVLKKYADLPNPQKLVPRIKMDPVPVKYPRPSQFLTEPM